MTNSEKVRDFSNTVAKSMGKNLPISATKIPLNQVKFLVKMILDESVELLAASGVKADERKAIIEGLLIADIDKRSDLLCPKEDSIAILEQADAIVDIEYYMKDVAARNGINTDAIFDIVHQANMNKRQLDGTFIMRSDGKVVKPEGWVSPEGDKIKEIERQISGNSFNA